MKQFRIWIFLFGILCICLTGCGDDEEYDYSYKGLPYTAEEYDYSYKGLPDTEGSGNETDSGSKTPASVIAYNSVEKAQKAIGYLFLTPSTIPTGYSLDEISVVQDGDKNFAQVNYKKDIYYITYRVSQTTEDLNSDRIIYEKEKEIIVSDTSVTCSCNNDIVFVARWQANGCYYCIMSEEGIDTTSLSVMISSLR